MKTSIYDLKAPQLDKSHSEWVNELKSIPKCVGYHRDNNGFDPYAPPDGNRVMKFLKADRLPNVYWTNSVFVKNVIVGDLIAVGEEKSYGLVKVTDVLEQNENSLKVRWVWIKKPKQYKQPTYYPPGAEIPAGWEWITIPIAFLAVWGIWSLGQSI